MSYLSFFFNNPATPEFYTLSLHDALPISIEFVNRFRGFEQRRQCVGRGKATIVLHVVSQQRGARSQHRGEMRVVRDGDRKSTRLNSSHLGISYAVFCLKKKKKHKRESHEE